MQRVFIEAEFEEIYMFMFVVLRAIFESSFYE